MSRTGRIAVMTVLTPHSWVVINSLIERFGPIDVLVEDRQGKFGLLLRRMRKHGVLTALGQVGFVVLQRLLQPLRQQRIDDIIQQFQLPVNSNSDCNIYAIKSVNSMACRTALAMIDPAVIVVVGTRIIGLETLAAIRAPVINYHAGWTPDYRGQAGGYWALAEGDAEHAGVTVHLVDEGVDTGAVLYREKFAATAADSFPTYYYLQVAVGRHLVLKAVDDILSGTFTATKLESKPGIFLLPTLWRYLWTGLFRQVW